MDFRSIVDRNAQFHWNCGGQRREYIGDDADNDSGSSAGGAESSDQLHSEAELKKPKKRPPNPPTKFKAVLN